MCEQRLSLITLYTLTVAINAPLLTDYYVLLYYFEILQKTSSCFTCLYT